MRLARQSAADLFAPEWTRSVEKQPQEGRNPPILFEVRFFYAEPGFLSSFGFRPGEPRTIGAQERDKLLASPRFKERKIEKRWRVVYPAGEGRHTRWLEQHSYVKDLVLEPESDDDGEPDLRWDIGVWTTGFAFALRASEKDGKVALERLEAWHADLLGIRHCQARIFSGTKVFRWHEPVILTGTASIEGGGIMLKREEESLVVRLVLKVESVTANARAYAREGKVEERYEPAEGLEGQMNGVDREYFLLLTATGTLQQDQ
jgi:hypothetical protein